eukprot:COSAG01_NODE_63_length_29632_cov_270.650662_27_plen_150_part_00
MGLRLLFRLDLNLLDIYCHLQNDVTKIYELTWTQLIPMSRSAVCQQGDIPQQILTLECQNNRSQESGLNRNPGRSGSRSGRNFMFTLPSTINHQPSKKEKIVGPPRSSPHRFPTNFRGAYTTRPVVTKIPPAKMMSKKLGRGVERRWWW